LSRTYPHVVLNVALVGSLCSLLACDERRAPPSVSERAGPLSEPPPPSVVEQPEPAARVEPAAPPPPPEFRTSNAGPIDNLGQPPGNSISDMNESPTNSISAMHPRRETIKEMEETPPRIDGRDPITREPATR
jgi:hypothetical protein